jgi:hypothetical protein
VPPSNPFAMPYWEDDPDFDLSRHLKRATLPALGDLEALQRFVESRMSVPFDRRHPLWELILVDGYGSGCALVSRFHHSLADGIALSQVLLSLANDSPAVDLDEIEAREASSPHSGGLIGAARSLIDTGAHAVRGGLEAMSMIPVNVRPPDQPLPRELGNKFALVYLKMPTGVRAPLERVSEAKRRMDWIKVSPEAFLTFGLNRVIGRLEPRLSNSLVNCFSDKAIGVTTNVIGPQRQRYIAGVPIAGSVGWVPGSGRQTLGVCIFSLAGIVRVGFKVDAPLVPDVEKLVHAFDEDLDQLLRIAASAV